MKFYKVNEMFYSLQGEGARAGTANVFVRFGDCNLRCSKHREGFDCDTEFTSSVTMTETDIVNHAKALVAEHDATPDDPNLSVIFTGGEPTLQLDDALVTAFGDDWYKCVETNGLRLVPKGIDWISVSPKTAEHTLCTENVAAELRYVRNARQGIPRPTLKSKLKYLSPAFSDHSRERDENLHHCFSLVKENPEWRLSVQSHKLWGVR